MAFQARPLAGLVRSALGWASQMLARRLGQMLARLGGQAAGLRRRWAGQAAGRLGWEAARQGWAGLAELSENWQVVVKGRIQVPTGITDSMDECSKVDM